MMNKKYIFLIAILVIAFSFCANFIRAAQKNFEENIALLNNNKAEWTKLNSAIKNRIMNFNGDVGLIIKDLDTGRTIVFNQDKPVPSASLVKIPVMMAYFYADAKKELKLSDNVQFRQYKKVSKSKGAGGWVSNIAVCSVEELFTPMITQSDNNAANLLIDRMGFSALNAYFKKLGLKNTNISRKMLDFKKRAQGVENYTTAADMAYLLEQLYYKDFLSQEVSEKCLTLLAQQKVNERIPRHLPKGTPIAHKTGLENHICHDAGIVYTERGDFLICVLVRHNNKRALPAKLFIADIARLSYNYFQNKK